MIPSTTFRFHPYCCKALKSACCISHSGGGKESASASVRNSFCTNAKEGSIFNSALPKGNQIAIFAYAYPHLGTFYSKYTNKFSKHSFLSAKSPVLCIKEKRARGECECCCATHLVHRVTLRISFPRTIIRLILHLFTFLG